MVRIHPGQAQASGESATVDIVEFADGHLILLYRGEVLRYGCYQLYGHLVKAHGTGDKKPNGSPG